MTAGKFFEANWSVAVTYLNDFGDEKIGRLKFLYFADFFDCPKKVDVVGFGECST